MQGLERSDAAGLAIILVLRAQVRGVFVRVDPHSADAAHQRELDAAHPHFHLSALPGIVAKQRRGWMQLLQVAANRNAFRQRRAVVEFQHRHLSQ